MAQKEKKNASNKKNAVKDKDKESSSEISRRFKQNPGLFIGTVVVLVLVIVSFVLVPALVPQAAGGAGGDYVFGYYDNTPIKWAPGNAFAQYREQAVYDLQAQGRDVNDYTALFEVWRRAYESTVLHTAVLQMMKKSNYSTPEKTVDREVAQLPQFKENGRFSSALYNQMSDSARLALWRQVSDVLSTGMFYDDYFGLLTPSTEVEFVSNMASVVREFELVYFKVDDYPESEYLAYARANSDLFRSIHLSRITVNSSEREARRILDSIKNGSITFEDAARAQSQDNYANAGGDMGTRYAYELETEIPVADDRSKILALRRGELSDLVRMGGGWAFFRVEDELKQPDFGNESPLYTSVSDDGKTLYSSDGITWTEMNSTAEMDRVRLYLRDFQRGRMEDWATEQANEFIADARDSGFENAALLRNMEVSKLGPLPINYGSVDLFNMLEFFPISGFSEQDIQNMSRNENFWTAAFKTTPQTPSEPIVQGNNVLVLFPLEQTNAEKDYIDNIASMYSSYWVQYVAEQSLQSYFLASEKMEDNFWDAFFRLFY